MLKPVLVSFVPIIVGMTTLTLLDAQLGNITVHQFNALFKNKVLRAITLFGAAYAANGCKLIPAVIAVYVYYAIVSSLDKPLPPKKRESTEECDPPFAGEADDLTSTIDAVSSYLPTLVNTAMQPMVSSPATTTEDDGSDEVAKVQD